jgi:hypothetical protein
MKNMSYTLTDDDFKNLNYLMESACEFRPEYAISVLKTIVRSQDGSDEKKVEAIAKIYEITRNNKNAELRGDVNMLGAFEGVDALRFVFEHAGMYAATEKLKLWAMQDVVDFAERIPFYQRDIADEIIRLAKKNIDLIVSQASDSQSGQTVENPETPSSSTRPVKSPSIVIDEPTPGGTKRK